ncbi:MAG: ABC transporter permease, partial [Coprococcus sp.]
KTREHDLDAMKKCGLGDMAAALNGSVLAENGLDEQTIAEKIRSCDDIVEKVDEIPVIVANLYELNGKNSSSSYFIMDYQMDYLAYDIYDGNDERIENPVLNPGEICVPICFKALYNCDIGDVVTFGDSELQFSFKIASYFEDPYWGSSMMGIKTVLLSQADIMKMSEVAVEDTVVEQGILLSIFKNDAAGLNDVDFERELNKRTSYAGYCRITISQSMEFNYMLLLVNIFSGILVAFIVMLVFVTIIVLSHNISSSIEQDYENLGILKAVGMTNGQLKMQILLGYMIASTIGVLVGIPTAIPVISIINDLIKPVTGLYVDSTPVIGFSLLAVLAIFVILLLFILVKLRKLSAITPVSAINGGRRDVHFSSLFKLPISKKMLGGSLAYRQLTSGKKQYIGAVIITALLVMFMVLVSDMCIWLGDGGAALAEVFSPIECELEVQCATPELYDEVDALIRGETDADTFNYTTRYLMLNDSQIHCTIVDDGNRYRTVYRGRSCIYDNEVLITEFVADGFHVGIGDSVNLEYRGKSAEFIVSGIMQCANDGGKCIAINEDGYMRIVGEKVKYTWTSYALEDKDRADSIISCVEEKYSDDEVSIRGNDFDLMKVISDSVNGLAVVIYFVAGIFIVVAIVLVCGKVFAREKQDYGIYKAMGFTSGMLRSQFAVRFLIASIVGSILGIVLALTFNDPIMNLIFSTFGLSNFTSSINLAAALLPIGFMGLIYYAFAYAISHKIKKVQPRVLITE